MRERMLAHHLFTTEDPKANTWHKVKAIYQNFLHRVTDNLTA
jgi:hypothetical protein